MTMAVDGGFHRRIRISPYPDRVVVGLEDNLHFFAMELAHSDGEISDLRMRMERYPWNICAGASAFLRQGLVGRKLDELPQIDISQHCTHLFELAVLCAAHTDDQSPVQYDLHVDDWVANRTAVRLLIDNRLVLDLKVHGTIVETPGEWFGRDVFQLSQSLQEGDAANREKAMLVARAIYVSLGRAAPMVDRAVERGPRILGVCYSYQPARVEEAARVPHSRREFSEPSRQPLEDFDPQACFATL
ncbi:MAG TPA: hypothetical protein VF503_28045 [Sphingobium sp.]|uniref:hypothetical protein n=1 Tax=Sphingobium sp. TaxID=1912891 RepID=UPI002ED0CBA1